MWRIFYSLFCVRSLWFFPLKSLIESISCLEFSSKKILKYCSKFLIIVRLSVLSFSCLIWISCIFPRNSFNSCVFFSPQIFWPQTTQRIWSFQWAFAGFLVMLPLPFLTLVVPPVFVLQWRWASPLLPFPASFPGWFGQLLSETLP